jgi:hypothetical protein
VKKLIKKYGDDDIDIIWLLGRSTYEGSFDMTKWLIDYFKLTQNEVRQADALIGACSEGHLQLAQWLTETYNLTIQDIRKNSIHVLERSDALDLACMGGHLDVATWLVEYFHLTLKDGNKIQHHYARWRDRDGHETYDQWFVRMFGNPAPR